MRIKKAQNSTYQLGVLVYLGTIREAAPGVASQSAYHLVPFKLPVFKLRLKAKASNIFLYEESQIYVIETNIIKLIQSFVIANSYFLIIGLI